MTLGPSVAKANSILTNEIAAVITHIKLHIGDPGAAGAGNPAVHTTRIAITWGTAAAGNLSNTNLLQWTSVTGAEDFTHWSGWSASTAGTFYESGLITANAVLIGDTFEIAIGDLDVNIPVAA